ncbi:MAG: GNAT family N-acetyltransferase [Acidiferrobacterales bacterium]
MDRDIIYRPALKPDSIALARLASIASSGVAEYAWTQLARPGEDIFDIARQRYEREGTQISYQHCTVAEANYSLIAMFLAWPEIGEAETETDPVLGPLVNLREEESYYIDCIAVFEDYRGQGIGSELMRLAEQQADEKGLNKTSLIVFEDNSNAGRLYERLGYKEVSRVATVPHELIHYTGDAILMVKTL